MRPTDELRNAYTVLKNNLDDDYKILRSAFIQAESLGLLHCETIGEFWELVTTVAVLDTPYLTNLIELIGKADESMMYTDEAWERLRDLDAAQSLIALRKRLQVAKAFSNMDPDVVLALMEHGEYTDLPEGSKVSRIWLEDDELKVERKEETDGGN